MIILSEDIITPTATYKNQQSKILIEVMLKDGGPFSLISSTQHVMIQHSERTETSEKEAVIALTFPISIWNENKFQGKWFRLQSKCFGS